MFGSLIAGFPSLRFMCCLKSAGPTFTHYSRRLLKRGLAQRGLLKLFDVRRRGQKSMERRRRRTGKGPETAGQWPDTDGKGRRGPGKCHERETYAKM